MSKFFDRSIKINLKKRFRNKLLKQNLGLLIYEKEILIIAVFLFISSSFLYKNKKEKFLYFDWRSYLKIFSGPSLDILLLCAIKYMLESNKITRNREQIIKTISFNNLSFKDEYSFFLIKKNSGFLEVDENIDFDKYKKLIEGSWNIFKIHEKLSKNPSYVIDLIAITCAWKELVFSMFDYKSEYMVYMFFFNLKK